MVEVEYTVKSARVMANIIDKFNKAVKSAWVHKHYLSFQQGLTFIQTFSLAKVLKQFRQKSYDATFGEMKQLYDRVCFVPIDVSNMILTEKVGNGEPNFLGWEEMWMNTG